LEKFTLSQVGRVFSSPSGPKLWYNGAAMNIRGRPARRHLILLTFILAMTGMGPAAAAGPGADPTPGELPATMGPIVADTAVPAPTGEIDLQPFWSLSLVGGNFTANWRRVGAGGNFASLEIPVKFTYGLASNLEVYLTAAFLKNWAGNVTQVGSPAGSADFSGLGDLFLAAKYQLLADTPRTPAVSALVAVNFPTGRHFRLNPARLGTDALGSGTYAFTLGFNLSKWLEPFYLYANLWYSLPTRDPGVVKRQQSGPLLFFIHGRDRITWNLAAEWVLTRRWVALLEFFSSWDVGPLCRSSREPLSNLLGILPGLECILSERWSCAAGVSLDLAGKNSTFAYTPIFTVLVKF
jgi:hypothetical protein